MAGVKADVATMVDKKDAIEQRLLETTIKLAREGGYDAVRQRDVAALAGVALATLYARFDSKNSLLAAALALEAERSLHRLAEDFPRRGRSSQSRVTKFFEHLTQVQLEHPLLTKAALRAATSGEFDATTRLVAIQGRIVDAAARAMRGSGKTSSLSREASLSAANVLVMVWFAHLTAWSAGLVSAEVIVACIHDTAQMLIDGAGE